MDLQGSGEEGEDDEQFYHQKISGGYSGEGGGGKENEDGRLVTFVACDTIVYLSVVTNQFIAWTYTESKCSFLSNVLFMFLYAHLKLKTTKLTCYICSQIVWYSSR